MRAFLVFITIEGIPISKNQLPFPGIIASSIEIPKNTLLFIGQIILIAFLGFLAKECWRIYGEQKQIARVNKDGIRVNVRLDKVSNEKKNWRDHIGNSRYVSFHHQGKEYTLRYIQDTIFLQEGASVPVTYSPSKDEFVQPGKELRTRQLYKTSPLVKWSVVQLFSGPNSVSPKTISCQPTIRSSTISLSSRWSSGCYFFSSTSAG